MVAVTQRIKNYLGGVSTQPDDMKLPGQVSTLINGYPDVALGLIKRPGLEYIETLGTGTDLDDAKWFYIHRDDQEKYIGCIKPGSPGDIAIWNATTGVSCTINYGTGAQAYLTGSKDEYHLMTIQDTTIITNNTVTVGTQAAPTFTPNTTATLILRGISSSAEYKIKIQGIETTITASSSNSTFDGLLTEEANHNLKDAIDNLISANSSNPDFSGTWTVTKDSDFGLTITRTVSGTPTAFTISASGGNLNTYLDVFQYEISNVSLLPQQSFHNHVVKIINTDSDNDTYYAKFVAYDGINGAGYWEETIAPDVSPGLDNATMPHELINTAVNTFTFKKVDYVDRLAGDQITNRDPSFVGAQIQQSFLHANRLGFISESNVILSQAGEFYNFFYKTAQTVIDSDPVDLNCSSIRPAVLSSVVSTAQGLILFSRTQQFIMFATDNILTPSTTSIRSISTFEMDKTVDPVDVGTNIVFISKTAGFTRLFSMVTRGNQENPQVLDISQTVAEFIPNNIDTLIASPQNQFVALSSQASDDIYLYSYYNDGEKTLLETWYSWKMPGLVETCQVDQDDMYVVTKQADEFTLCKANINQSPDSAIIVNSNGQRVNPCVDLYAVADSVTYNSTTKESKCYLPYSNVSSLTPVLLIAGDAQTDGFVESGFTITPETGTDGTGDYFIVPKKDLTSEASNVIVGFKYDFEVELPKIYYKLNPEQTISDFTARLSIARCVFSLGLSGLMSFKLKSNGSLPKQETYTGDGSTTDFPFNFSYSERDQIKVKVNGIQKTDFTFANDQTITLATAADAGDSVVIYIDEWVYLDPVPNANYYLANDIALSDEQQVTIPIHQNNKNFTLKLFNNSPFPVSVGSMMWEGNYSPRFYRRV